MAVRTQAQQVTQKTDSPDACSTCVGLPVRRDWIYALLFKAIQPASLSRRVQAHRHCSRKSWQREPPEERSLCFSDAWPAPHLRQRCSTRVRCVAGELLSVQRVECCARAPAGHRSVRGRADRTRRAATRASVCGTASRARAPCGYGQYGRDSRIPRSCTCKRTGARLGGRGTGSDALVCLTGRGI